jgi:hypothetical protein
MNFMEYLRQQLRIGQLSPLRMQLHELAATAGSDWKEKTDCHPEQAFFAPQ